MALTYVNDWSRATRADQAHRVDLELLQDLETMQDGVVVVDVTNKYRRLYNNPTGTSVRLWTAWHYLIRKTKHSMR